MSSASLPEPVEVVRVRDLLDRLVAANETHLRSRPRLIALPFPEELTLKELVTTKPRTVRFAVPEEALDGCDEHEFWGGLR